MNKLVLIIVGLFLVGFSANGQDLEFSNADDHVSGISGTETAVELSSKIDVTNATDLPIVVGCKREILLQEASASAERFCWAGLCFEAGTDVAPLTLEITENTTISPNDTVVGFTGYYNYNDDDGVCQIKYTFYEVDNEANSTEVVVHYCVGSNSFCQTFLGTNEITLEEVQTEISPNPTSGNFMISYQLVNLDTESKITIYNLLGDVVKEVQIGSRIGVANFNSSEFESGMYIYSITNGNKISGSYRFIVQ